MDLGIKGRKAIVCASSRGLGRACAQALAEAGCTVVINGRDPSAVRQTADEIRDRTGAEIIIAVADLNTEDGQATLLGVCPAADILITNNGGPPPRHFRDLDRAMMVEGMLQNMIVPIHLVQAVIGGMIERRFGRIVNITAASVKMPVANLELSSGSRAGLTAFLSGVARDVAPHGVTINNILPGRFLTGRLASNIERTAKIQGRAVAEVQRERLAGIPAGRFGEPYELGNVCALLCSAHAGYITGQNIVMDGGTYNAAF